MLYEIKYQRKSDPENRVFKSTHIADSPVGARIEFDKRTKDSRDYLVLSIRDISTEEITLEVKDVSQKQKGAL